MSKCAWALASDIEQHYHDHEWGVPLHDDKRLFEFLILEGFQAGLSWRTILAKRQAFRAAFDGFDAERVSVYGSEKVDRLINDAGIVRNRQKIEAAVANARAFLQVQQDYGSFDQFIWQFVGGKPLQNHWQYHAELPAFTKESQAMSRSLQSLGFKFVGKTICYAFMQATGMVNDHTVDCYRHAELVIK